jgi:hypothetical protein
MKRDMDLVRFPIPSEWVNPEVGLCWYIRPSIVPPLLPNP